MEAETQTPTERRYSDMTEEERKAYHLQKAREYRERNHEKFLESQRKYYAKNALTKREQYRERYRRLKELHIEDV